tara:strand:- start:7288 stop:7701 length:414 start_codon:yes stop_codon:yes gene_type:complete
MARTQATISLTSADITGDPLNLTKTTLLTKAGTDTGLDEFTGITKRIYPAAVTDTVIAADADYASTTVAHKVYIANDTPDNLTSYITIELEGNILLGRLYPGDFCFLPWAGTLDVMVTTVDPSVCIHYGVFSQSVAS